MGLNLDTTPEGDFMKRILVVDDHLHIRKLIKEALELRGYYVEAAENGAQAIKRVVHEPFELVITDIFMPVKDGLEVISKIKALSLKTKIIAVSGGGTYNNENCLRMAELLGASGTLRKPFDLNTLVEMVGQVLKE